MEEYLQTLRKQLKDFSPEEQEALVEEISSHIESGEADPHLGMDVTKRRKKLMNELGSPKDMGAGFKELYRPSGWIDFLLIVVPYFFYPYLNSLYASLMPTYSWADLRLDIVIHLPLIAIGLWRRSAPLTLFWITVTVFQLLIITTEIYWYYGIQTVFWAFLLLVLLVLAGYLLLKHRHDLLIVVFGLVPLSMCILGSILSALQPTNYSFGFLGQSLLTIHSSYNDSVAFFGLLLSMAIFFLAANRSIRWLALGIYGLHLGLGHYYLNDVVPIWVYDLWVIFPLAMVFIGWWLEWSKSQQLKLATS